MKDARPVCRRWPWLAVAVTLAQLSCSPPPKPLAGPPSERLIALPAVDAASVDPVLLRHVLRGLHFFAAGHPAAAVPDLHMALAGDPDSPFLHERLSLAWAASGESGPGLAVLQDGLARAPFAPGLNLLAGEFASSEGRFREAANALERAVGDDTLLVRVGPELLDTLLWIHDDPRAEARALELARRAPGDAGFAFALGSVLEEHGKLTAALDLYRQARRQRPSDIASALGEARLLGLLGRYHDAAQAIVPLFKFYPDELGYYIETVRLLRRAHSPEADTYRAEALRQSEGDPTQRLRLVAADLADGKRRVGMALLHDTIIAWPDRADIRLFLAEALLEDDNAEGCLEALAPLAGSAAPLHRLRGECLAARGQIATAVAEFEAAIRAGSARDELVAAVGVIARYADDEKTASAARDRLLAQVATVVTPQDAILAQAATLDYFGHAEALSLVATLHPEAGTDIDLVLRWTDLAARYGQADAALSLFGRLVQWDEQNPVLLNALGFTLADAGLRLDDAEVFLRRAYRLAPDQSFIVDSLGWLLYRRGDHAGAARLLEEASSLNPTDAEILRHLGDVYTALGRLGAARSCFEKALSERPALPIRTLLRARLAGSAA